MWVIQNIQTKIVRTCIQTTESTTYINSKNISNEKE